MPLCQIKLDDSMSSIISEIFTALAQYTKTNVPALILPFIYKLRAIENVMPTRKNKKPLADGLFLSFRKVLPDLRPPMELLYAIEVMFRHNKGSKREQDSDMSSFTSFSLPSPMYAMNLRNVFDIAEKSFIYSKATLGEPDEQLSNLYLRDMDCIEFPRKIKHSFDPDSSSIGFHISREDIDSYMSGYSYYGEHSGLTRPSTRLSNLIGSVQFNLLVDEKYSDSDVVNFFTELSITIQNGEPIQATIIRSNVPTADGAIMVPLMPSQTFNTYSFYSTNVTVF